MLNTAKGEGFCFGNADGGGDQTQGGILGGRRRRDADRRRRGKCAKVTNNLWSQGHEMDFAGVTQVYSTTSAFLALNTAKGEGHCWGGGHSGDNGYRTGDCSHINFEGVNQVYATGFAFLAVNTSGLAQKWGDNDYWSRWKTGVPHLAATIRSFRGELGPYPAHYSDRVCCGQWS